MNFYENFLLNKTFFMKPYKILFGIILVFQTHPNYMAAQITQVSTQKNKTMIKADNRTDKEILSGLNAQFIKNFINQDTVAHNEIIHKDFICIESSGVVVNREDYMKAWASDYGNGNFSSFIYVDEVIRIFGDIALVRSKTVYTRVKDGKAISGNSTYTDTYIKEDGRWWCIQAQITPIKQ